MKILVRRAGIGVDITTPLQQWPVGWPPPRVGELVTYADREFTVATVDWHPDDNPEPFVYVIVRTPR